MNEVTLNIGTHISFDINSVDEEVVRRLRVACNVDNPEFSKRVKQQMSVYGVKEKTPMYTIKNNVMSIPRGYGRRVRQGLQGYGYKVSLNDRRAVSHVHMESNPISLRPHQLEPVEELITAQQGIYEASPGAGKTVVSLELFRRLSQKTVILVDKKNIAKQWQERAKEHLGITTGFIGDGCFQVEDLTIALVPTLFNSKNKLALEGFFNSFGMVIADECHHIVARTWQSVIESFPAKYRFGVSATPDRENGYFPIAKFVLGDVVHKTDREDLVKNKTIIKPDIKLVKTDFNFNYIPTHHINDKICSIERCDQTKKKHNNNFNELLSEIIKDKKRNNLIARNILANLGKRQIVISKRTNHLNNIKENLEEKLTDSSNIFYLSGKDSLKTREEVIHKVGQNSSAILFTTLADEALDIKQLEVMHLTFPTSSAPLLRQQIGRVERNFEGKSKPIVFDYCDKNVDILSNQSQKRLGRVYLQDGLHVQFLKDNEKI